MSDFFPSAKKPETDTDIRCHRCNKLLIEMATRPWKIKCPRCKATNQALDGSPPDEAHGG